MRFPFSVYTGRAKLTEETRRWASQHLIRLELLLPRLPLPPDPPVRPARPVRLLAAQRIAEPLADISTRRSLARRSPHYPPQTHLRRQSHRVPRVAHRESYS